jgi:hypothetical protein
MSVHFLSGVRVQSGRQQKRCRKLNLASIKLKNGFSFLVLCESRKFLCFFEKRNANADSKGEGWFDQSALSDAIFNAESNGAKIFDGSLLGTEKNDRKIICQCTGNVINDVIRICISFFHKS